MLAQLIAAFLIAGSAAMVLTSSRHRLAQFSQHSADVPADGSGMFATLSVQRIIKSVGYRLRATRRRAACRAAAVELTAALAAELRAGQSVRPALERAAQSAPGTVCPRAVGAARLGGDVPSALRRDCDEQGLPVLRSLAALWQVGEQSGAGLAEAADRLAAAEAAGESVRRELSTQLAGPRATARVLAGLPILGLLLGSGLGASPIRWLTGTPWGLLILVAGCALEVAGIWWTSRLTRSVEALL